MPKLYSNCPLRRRCDWVITISGTEHLLLGLIKDGEGVASEVLKRFGADRVVIESALSGGAPGERGQLIRKYRTFFQVLREMVAWLVEQGVTHVAMEATGVYWKPVYHALCEAEQIEVLLVNARHSKNVPGHKTDRASPTTRT